MGDHVTTTVEVVDTSVTVRRAGSGPPLLFLHGEGATSGWRAIHDALAGTFAVHAPVHPGFGGGEVPDWVRGSSDLVFHLIDLLDVLNVSRPVVVGESIGGWVAADLALHRPDLVAGLVLVGALGLRPSNPMPDLFLMAGPDAIAHLAETLDGSRLDPLTGDTDAVVELWADQAGQARLMWERPYDPAFPRRLHHIACPSTVVWGGADRLLSPDHGRALAALIPGADFELVDGAGHLVTVDAPAAVADAARRIIRCWRPISAKVS